MNFIAILIATILLGIGFKLGNELGDTLTTYFWRCRARKHSKPEVQITEIPKLYAAYVIAQQRWFYISAIDFVNELVDGIWCDLQEGEDGVACKFEEVRFDQITWGQND